MPTAGRPIQVTGPSTFKRIVIGTCIVIIMTAITVIALKLGMRDGSPASPNPGSPASPTTAPSTGTSAEPTVGTFAAPKTTKAAGHRTAPTDPSDLGVLVNKEHPLRPSTYEPKDLASLGDEKLRKQAATALRELIAGAKEDGHALMLVSGYRSAERQESLHQSYVELNGKKKAERFSARAGQSEHQTGLAADVGSGTCDVKKCFANTYAGKWVAKHAHEYGFIVRYPKGQEKVTGYDYEPWHLRFLGREVTEDYVASGAKTLEAYYGIE
ncbi:M15 family metallopeptidase [Galactobacter sp.]|uniref:M15 family metallopeptidase n=1 Tax=Galactobacter sp. TaxID=2676125 RepID=UPI0025C2D4FD|nr:M15 family metallopeptidase [Galactobacter sp.]